MRESLPWRPLGLGLLGYTDSATPILGVVDAEYDLSDELDSLADDFLLIPIFTVAHVPRLRRLPVKSLFFREYTRHSAD